LLRESEASLPGISGLFSWFPCLFLRELNNRVSTFLGDNSPFFAQAMWRNLFMTRFRFLRTLVSGNLGALLLGLGWDEPLTIVADIMLRTMVMPAGKEFLCAHNLSQNIGFILQEVLLNSTPL
jgi:hypothetical protein